MSFVFCFFSLIFGLFRAVAERMQGTLNQISKNKLFFVLKITCMPNAQPPLCEAKIKIPG